MSGKTGLHNLGNTCYLNTILQCLGHCEVFRNFILDKQYRVRCEGDTLIDGVSQTFHTLWRENQTGAPRQLVRVMAHKLKNMMYVFEQNDISEFVGLLVDKLHQEIAFPLLVNPLHGMVYRNHSYDQQRKKMDEAWIEAHKKEYSPLTDLFHGQLVSQIICGGCNKIHHNYEIFLNTTLSIHGSTLDDCLNHHFEDETINHEDTPKDELWVCDACKTSAPSVKTTRLWRNPKVLMVTLKRFNANLQKINQDVEIPHVLDLSEHTLGPTPTKYTLQSVGFHLGSYMGGHYVSVCKLSTGEWVLKDDESVHSLSNEQLKDLNKGYVFFYEDLSSS